MNIFSNTKNLLSYTVSKAVIGNDLHISVKNGDIIVKAPWYYSQKRIQEIIEEKKKWILEKVKESEKNAIAKKDSSLLKYTKVFGKNYSININYKNIKKPTLNLETTHIDVILPLKYKHIDNTDLLNTMLEKMYFSVAESEVAYTMDKLRISLGFTPEDYKIEKLENMIATYKQDLKTIIIDPSIVMHKKTIIEFIILHEFCHTKYKTHSKKFIEIMQKYSSNYSKLLKETENLKY